MSLKSISSSAARSFAARNRNPAVFCNAFSGQGGRRHCLSSRFPNRAAKPCSFLIRRHKASIAHADSRFSVAGPSIPNYLNDVYWWAYVQPSSIKILDSQTIVDAILWGNFDQLRDAALDELANHPEDGDVRKSWIRGRTLQVACVYGNLTERLYERMAPNSSSSLDVVDVVPAQLDNLKRKLERSVNQNNANSINLLRYDVEDLGYENDSFDQIICFFLLHEMPNSARLNTLKEAARVLKPGGKIVIVDYHRPDLLMHRLFLSAVFHTLEPFAMDIWRTEIQDWLPKDVVSSCNISKTVYCGAKYQKVVIEKEK